MIIKSMGEVLKLLIAGAAYDLFLNPAKQLVKSVIAIFPRLYTKS